MNYPEPQIGYYQAECCLLDLYKIENEEQLKDAKERVDDSEDFGPLMIFATLAEAIKYLADGHTPEERAEQFKRLGWSGV